MNSIINGSKCILFSIIPHKGQTVRAISSFANRLHSPDEAHRSDLLQIGSSSYVPVRHANFFNKHTAEQLWKGVTSVSNAGAKKGRARSLKKAKNLNRGQIIGVGAVNVMWPGLNAPVLRNNEINRHRVMDPDPSRQEELYRLRDSMSNKRFRLVHPLERGWSGTKFGGRRIGPPDPIGEDTFEGFDTVCLEFKIVNHMTGQHGRKRSFSAFVVTGNSNGLAGFGLAKSSTGMVSIHRAKNKAAQQLVYINRFENHTVMHDFFTEFGSTKIYAKKMHKGFGLVCHRAIREICEMFGISDIYAKVEGAINVQAITKAFILGLLRQKSYQQMAEEKQLHLVEFRAENLEFPKVLASPKNAPVRKLSEINPNENLDVSIHCMDNRVPLVRKKRLPFYVGSYGHEKYLRSYQYRRNDDRVKRDLIKEYGQVKSFYFDEYPECIFFRPTKREDTSEGDDY